MNKNNTIVVKDLIEISERLCSDKLQPEIKVGQKYYVQEIDKLADGTQVLIVQNPNKKGKVIRLNAKRFACKKTSFDEIAARQEQIKWQAEEKILSKSIEEQMNSKEAISVVYIPHVVETMAVRYLLKCHKFCGKEHKFSEYWEIGKRVPNIERASYYEQIKEIKFDVYKLIEQAVDMFTKEYVEDINKLWLAIRRELCRAYPFTLPEGKVKDNMRTDAIFGLILLRIMKMCCMDHDNTTAAQVGKLIYEENNRIGDIEECFNVYAGNIEKFNFDNIKAEINNLKQKFTNIQFTTEKTK